MDLSLIIKEIRKSIGLSQDEFASKIGLTRSNLSQIEIGRNTPSVLLLNDIANIFHIDISTIFEMINSEKKLLPELLPKLLPNKKNGNLNSNPNGNLIPKNTIYSESNIITLAAEPIADYNKPNIIHIPVVNIEAAAGSGYYNDPYLNTSDQISLPANMVSKSGMNICIKIKGDSMSPTLLDSSYLIINNIHPSEWANIPDGHVCVVSDREGRTYVKRIKNRLNKGFIVCMSDNVDKANYPNFNLQTDEINTIWHAEWYISAKMPNINENYYSKLIQLEDNFEDLKNDMKEILKQIKPKQ
nr:MAG TPA: Repressor protein CI [Caudoviricetes sp.]